MMTRSFSVPFALALLLGAGLVATDIQAQVIDWATVSKGSADSAVKVYSFNAVPNIFEPYKTPSQFTATGTAFFVEVDGVVDHMVTNFHVLENAVGAAIEISSLGREKFEVEIVKVYPERDMAIIKLSSKTKNEIEQKLKRPLKALALGDSDVVQKTQAVMAMGFPQTDEGLKSTTGIISGKERLDNNYYLQITAPINFGNSGGPTVNARGEVIGINTAIRPGSQNTGYMIPVNDLKMLLKNMRYDKSILFRKPVWGVYVGPTCKEFLGCYGHACAGGMYIRDVIKGGLFEKHGVQKNDVLYKVNGYELDMHGQVVVPWYEDKVSFTDVLQRLDIGKRVDLVLDRAGKEVKISFNVELNDIYEIDEKYLRFEKLSYEVIAGMVVMPLTLNHIHEIFGQFINGVRHGYTGLPDLTLIKMSESENRLKPCLFISNVLANSQAHKKYLPAGTILDKVNGQVVRTLTDFYDAAIKSKQTGYLTIESIDGFRYALSLDEIVKEEAMLRDYYYFPRTPVAQEIGC